MVQGFLRVWGMVIHHHRTLYQGQAGQRLSEKVRWVILGERRWVTSRKRRRGTYIRLLFSPPFSLQVFRTGSSSHQFFLNTGDPHGRPRWSPTAWSRTVSGKI